MTHTWRRRGGHVAPAGGTDGPDRRRDGASAHARRLSAGPAGGRREATSGGDVARRRRWAVRKREGKKGKGSHRRRSTTASGYRRRRWRDKLRGNLMRHRRWIREVERERNGRKCRPKAAAMEGLTGARRRMAPGGGFRRGRAGRRGPWVCEPDGSDGEARWRL